MNSERMRTQETPGQAERLWQQADTAVRENPVPAILTAIAVGFGVGLLVRALQPERRPEPIRDSLDETRDFLSSLFRPFAKNTRRAYSTSSHAVRDTFERAADKAKQIDVDDYVDPIVKWWRQLWS